MAKGKNNYYALPPELTALSNICMNEIIPPELYTKHEVFRGLRDLNGNGVRAGLTRISEVSAKRVADGKELPAPGKLYYQGFDVEDLVAGLIAEDRFGFEETIYLLLFGDLPGAEQLAEFKALLARYCSLPPKFTRDIIMKAPSSDMMNALARSVLTLYYYDPAPDDTSIPNILRQCLQLIMQLPLLAVYGYHAYNHYERGRSFFIHQPDPSLSMAENLLHILRPDQKYSVLEAKILDLALVLHAEHGGGNNSTFTTHVVASSGTDTYSVIAAAIGSLKGPKHGGANIRVKGMMEDLAKTVTDPKDEEQLEAYILKLLRKEAYDKSGLVYGVGHAVYSLSDPRAVVFERFVRDLSLEKGRAAEYELYAAVARLAPEVISRERRMYKGVSANIDFYSGFVYDMLGLPTELYTPLFAVSRIAGWSAHRIEEVVNGGKIIRPAYKCIQEKRPYVPLEDRDGGS